jgi:hypothetical protein
MTKIAILLLAAVFFENATAQQNVSGNIPKDIVQAFSKTYPAAHVKHWKMDSGNYAAEFLTDKKKAFAVYSPGGQWLNTTIKIRFTKNLPDAVKTALSNSKYNNWYVDEIKELQSPNNHLFLVYVNNGSLLDSDHYDAFKEDYLLYFDADGKLMRSEELR